MSNIVKFTETIFSERNKQGVLKPDEHGYYTVILGGLNTFNSVGEYYTAEKAIELFKESSSLMRRIRNGALYAELGHPKRLPGMSLEDFYNRILTIDEGNICGHISEITLDLDYGKNHPELNNPQLIAIIGKIKPAGPKAQALQIALDNPKQNAAFSVRGLTENVYRNGRVERILTNIITWDHVVEPGIAIANKAFSPVLESRKTNITEIEDHLIDKAVMKKVINNTMDKVSLESNREMMNEILSSLGNQKHSRLLDW